MNNIYCKSSIDREQIEARRGLQKSGIELQLLADFIDSPKPTSEYVKSLGVDVKEVRVIHVPLKSGEELVEVQMLSEGKCQEIFNRVCSLAQNISQINKHNVLIVVHNSWGIKAYHDSRKKYAEIKEYLKITLDKYPDIKIGIENVVPYAPKNVSGFRNGTHPNYVEFVKCLREELETCRIGSVLDTCHAMVTMRIDKLIKEFGGCREFVSMEDYFVANQGICMLIHLCNVEKLGYGAAQHGIGFNFEEKKCLEEIIDLYERYTCDADVTIEVIEDNYLECKEYEKTKKMIGEIIGEGR